MTDDDVELPPETQELVDTFPDWCLQIENQAVDMLRSVEIPLFGILRDLSATKCYSILARLRDWFGTTPGKEHYLCLIMVTDYVSCSYNNNDFYGTFVKEKKDKFYESFFVKLMNEWKVVFHKMPFTVLSSLDQVNLLKNSLRVSFARFPNQFRFKGLLSEIMNSCDEYSSRLQKYLSNLKSKQHFKISPDIVKSASLPGSPSNTSVIAVIRPTSGSKSASKSVPSKAIVQKAATPKSTHILVQDSLPITPLALEPKKIDFGALSSKEAIKQPAIVTIDDSPVKVDKTQSNASNIITIDDSPVKVDKTQSKLENITNVISSKVLKRPADTEISEILDPSNTEGKLMKLQNNDKVSNQPSKTSLPKKLNAFDILMRKKVVKTIS